MSWFAAGQLTIAVNVHIARIASGSAPTADNSKNGHNDLSITRRIRRSIIADKTLSTYGHNVKIFVQNGAVTLKGPVRSEGEKASIEAKAVHRGRMGGFLLNQAQEALLAAQELTYTNELFLSPRSNILLFRNVRERLG